MKKLLTSILGESDARALTGLSLRHKLYLGYFGMSFCLLCVGDESAWWAVALVVANFANACRVARKVDLKLDEQ